MFAETVLKSLSGNNQSPFTLNSAQLSNLCLRPLFRINLLPARMKRPGLSIGLACLNSGSIPGIPTLPHGQCGSRNALLNILTGGKKDGR
jgi:hypothetical protein